MGNNCIGSKPRKISSDELVHSICNKFEYKVSAIQVQLLKLIYKDLAQRTTEKLVNLENFLLFFHKNGFWGDRLFKQFDSDESNLICQEQFIKGIATILKSSQKEKILLLFKFFSRGQESQNGISFDDFLKMLYNYPKQDLKEILNDKDFFQNDLKKKLKSIDQNRRFQSIYSNGATHGNQNELKFRYDEENVGQQIEKLQSLARRDIMKQFKGSETNIQVNIEDKVVEVSTINIHQLVKKFALSIFKEASTDPKTGRLSHQKFEKWVMNHKKLFNNYYDGFHFEVWQMDSIAQKPKYLTCQPDKMSIVMTKLNNKFVKVMMILVHSTIIVCEEKNHIKAIQIICLEGLSVKKYFVAAHGFGIEITHRDGIYENKKFFFINEQVQNEWMGLLKYFKGASVQQLYDISRKIGAGKFSVVYDCKEISTGNQFAIKVIETYKLDLDAKNLIAHQSSIMKIVSHPLLVAFKECIQTKTHIYIITELVKGRDLFELVRDCKHLTQQESASITQQIIVGVQYLHSLGIVHRDLKPENIMVALSEDGKEIGKIKIIDFGFSNYIVTLNEGNNQDVLAGTPNYIAPQILLNKPISFSIDIFAIGVILFFMLSGTLPFNDYNLKEIFNRTIKGDYSFKEGCWNRISDQAKDLISKLLENDPKQRITLEKALVHPWFKELKISRQKSNSSMKKTENLKNGERKTELF